MPVFLEKALAKSGRAHGFSGRRLKRYVYGGMNSIGAMHGNQETEKGAEMERKHENDHPRRGVMRRAAGR